MQTPIEVQTPKGRFNEVSVGNAGSVHNHPNPQAKLIQQNIISKGSVPKMIPPPSPTFPQPSASKLNPKYDRKQD